MITFILKMTEYTVVKKIMCIILIYIEINISEHVYHITSNTQSQPFKHQCTEMSHKAIKYSYRNCVTHAQIQILQISYHFSTSSVYFEDDQAVVCVNEVTVSLPCSHILNVFISSNKLDTISRQW